MDPGFPFMTFFATFFLTFNTVLAVIQAVHHDTLAIAFILSTYVSVILLFLCIHAYDRLPEGSERRERLKIPVWTLMTTLQVVSAYRVSIILPLVWDLLVWILGAFISLIGYYFFFIYSSSASDNNRSGGNQSSPVEML